MDNLVLRKTSRDKIKGQKIKIIFLILTILISLLFLPMVFISQVHKFNESKEC